MDEQIGLTFSIVVWLAVLSLICYRRMTGRDGGVGLVMAYVISLSIIHLTGALVHVVPGYTSDNLTFRTIGYQFTSYSDLDALTTVGFLQSSLGLVAFAIGVGVASRLLPPAPASSVHRPPPLPHARLILWMIGLGLAAYFVLGPVFGRTATVASLVAMMNQLLTVGLALACWRFWRQGPRFAFWSTLGVALCWPLLTVVRDGFLFFGSIMALTVLAFCLGLIRPRWISALLALALVYVSLSIFVNYMRDRYEIRAVVWGGEATESRLATIQRTFASFEPFDPSREFHLFALDSRLNQNILVGMAKDWLDIGYRPFANGATLGEAVLALVPRALWPDKSIVAGSPRIVSEYTGFNVMEGTSVGVGHVMEFYINFGTVGVILGFFVIGMLLTLTDRLAGRRLTSGEWGSFTLWYLCGIGMLHVGGSLVELTGSCAAGVVVGLVVKRALAAFAPPAPAAVVRRPLVAS